MNLTRRQVLQGLTATAACGLALDPSARPAAAANMDGKTATATRKGLDWVARP